MRGNFITDRNGSKNPNYKDGRKKTRLYRIYHNMKTRCYNSKSAAYDRYGARGITVCDEWKDDFQAFYDWSMSHGYADNLTIDRIENDGNYEPGNCRWVTMKEQSNNRNRNHVVRIGDDVKTLQEWCDEYNITYQTVQDRLKRGWNEIDAIMLPVQTKFKRKVVQYDIF